MTTHDEYRQFADACIRWAQTAKTEERRRAFLEMAAAWTELLTMKAETRAQHFRDN